MICIKTDTNMVITYQNIYFHFNIHGCDVSTYGATNLNTWPDTSLKSDSKNSICIWSVNT